MIFILYLIPGYRFFHKKYHNKNKLYLKTPLRPKYKAAASQKQLQSFLASYVDEEYMKNNCN